MKKRREKTQIHESKRLVRRRESWILLLLVGLGAIAYWNSFDVPFVFDDLATIGLNSSVQFGDALAPSQLWSRSVLYITFAANYWFGRQNVWGYHLVNWLLHVLNGLLVYFLAKHIFSRFPEQKGLMGSLAFLAAAFFLVHPVQTESVTYISSRSELLSTLFYLLAILIFAHRSPDRIGFVFSLMIGVIFVIGLGAKETVISLPGALFLYDFIFLSGGKIRPTLTRWRFYIPFVAGGLASAIYLLTVTLKGAVGGAPGNLPPYHYFLTQLRVIVRYVQITLIPAGLNLAHDFRPSTSFMEAKVIASALFVLALIVLGWLLRERKPVFAFSIFWFFVTLAPTSSFVPVLDVVFEHRLYLPMVGICLSLPLLIQSAHRFVSSKIELPLSPLQISSMVIAVLVIGTVVRNEVWRDEVRLWSDVIEKSPRLARGYNGLAQTYFVRGEYGRAVDAAVQGLRNVQENQPGFYSDIAHFYLKLGRFDDALEAFSKSLERSTTPVQKARAYYNMAVTYGYKWNELKARQLQTNADSFLQQKEKLLSSEEEALLKSLELDSHYLPAWDSYINVAVDRGKQEGIRVELLQQIQGNPDAKALYGLGKLAMQGAEYKDAANYFNQAAAGYNGEKMFLFNYAYVLEEVGDVQGAIDKYVAALRLDPLFLEAHHNLAQLYVKKGLNQSAAEHFERVLQLDARQTSAHLQLARILIQRGELASARNHLRTVLDLAPGNQEAASLWQKIGS